ncbi:glycosyltransferase [Desulfovibrio sp. OttesenSCG-928-A18]|nr:glycosyltransferase [Desulfovibrio sp. OttesenSCG-928-A18]
MSAAPLEAARPPSLTVLMTVRNGMPYLRDALRSLLEQSLKGFTLLIIDSASTDGTRPYLDAMAETFAGEKGGPPGAPELSIVHLDTNVGRTGALIHGLSLIKTQVTAIMDADNIAAPKRLERQYDFLLQNPEISLVGSDITYIDSNGNNIRQRRFPTRHKDLLAGLALGNQFTHSACAFRTEAALRAGGYPASFAQARDSALWIAMLARGDKAASIPEPLVMVRLHAGSAANNLAMLVVRTKESFRLAQALQRVPGLGRSARQAALMRASWALMRLGRKRLGFKQLWKAIRTAPLRAPFNPLLWRGLFGAWLLRRRWWTEN